MDEEIELLVRKFEDEIARNSDYRIEEFPVDPTLFEKWTKKEKDFFFREIILAETDARFADKQPLNKKEYEQRFPNLLKHVDDAFDRLDKLRQEKDSFDLMNVTMDYQGGLVVHLQGRSDLPEELGRFREITPIAEGGFGIVCRAYDSEAHMFRALKFPTRTYSRDDEFLAEVRKEADCAGNLDHPNIVKTIGMEVIDPFPFVVQEFVEGTNLRDWMNTERSFPAKAKMMAKIAGGLHFAHINDITHLDIKPENILVDDDDQPKITDFGMAFHEKNRLGLPRRNIMGTMKYLSPEVAKGYLRQADNRADIFSLGVIFYEMLTGRKPFGHGNNDEEEIILEITTKEPQPISFDKANVPDELRRICVKCLQKKILDRYQLASEVERELNEWIAISEKSQTTSSGKSEAPDQGVTDNVVRRKFVPRGIASYTEEDGDFFLDLLPGVRDQGDVPASITFWTRRICAANSDTPTVPNAFIFGPSGSGKSSFVKAGLFPQIQKQVKARRSEPVQTIYVESTRDDTEVRLLNALRKKYPDIPSDESLPDVFAGLANGRWQTSAARPTKILLVIDQFEQWISRGEEFETTQLVHALKHCNGEQLQCLMLVRDDFVYACNRFADSLDINLEEGKNYQNVDPFDKKHARKILIKHLHAYDETFPDNEESLQREQKDFLKEAIQQLAEDNRIVCVRLILFAEMFKDREWTVKELKSVGGVAGVGEQFLESHFGDEGNRLHRIYRKQVQAIFEELLPEAGTKIRGVMKSREDLMAAAKCENDKATFDKIIHLLETELKLVTATEPDTSIEHTKSSSSSQSGSAFFQLTHDYLVPSIRNWLDAKLRNTRRGRALIRLRELAAQVVPGQKPKYLPSVLEWISWKLWIAKEKKTNAELVILQHGLNKSLLVFSLWFLAVAISLIVGFYSFARIEINSLLFGPIDGVPASVKKIVFYRIAAKEHLRHSWNNPSLDEESRYRALYGLLPLDDSAKEHVVERLLNSSCSPSELKVATRMLEIYAPSSYGQLELRKELDDDLSPASIRLRAVSALCQLKNRSVEYNNFAEMIGSAIANEPVETQVIWIELLSKVGDELVKPYQDMFLRSDDRFLTHAIAKSLARYSDNWDVFFADKLRFTNPSQFESILLTVFVENHQIEFLNLLNAVNTESFDDEQRAIFALAKLRLGDSSTFQRMLGDTTDLGRGYLMGLADSSRVQFHQIRRIYTKLPSDSYAARQAALLILSGLIETTFDQRQLRWLETLATQICVNEPNAGCFAAGELICRQLAIRDGRVNILNLRKRRRRERGAKHGDIFINHMGMPFAIFRPTSANQLDRLIAVSMYQITNSEFEKFRDLGNNSTPFKPFEVKDYQTPIDFCKWLTGQSEDLVNQQCFSGTYKTNESRPTVDLNKLGYRLCTPKEMAAIQKSTFDLISKDRGLAKYFTWSVENSSGNVQNVGNLFPSLDGIFDIYGNTFELYFDVDLRNNQFKNYRMVGGSILYHPSTFQKNDRDVVAVEQIYYENVGMRLIKTFKD